MDVGWALPVLWVGLGAVVVVSSLRARRARRAYLTGVAAVSALWVVGGAAANGYLLARGDDYSRFADGASTSFVHETWESLVVPHHIVFIGLLIAFEAVAGALVLVEGRIRQTALLVLMAFNVALLSFGWGYLVWSVPIVLALAHLWRLGRRPPRGDTSRLARRGPSTRQLLAEVVDVAHDLPAFLTAPLYRRWHRHWGSTPTEQAERMPGDELLPRAQFRATRAITIAAPPRAVWPWLVQVGAGRAGWYSNDLLDNLGRPSSSVIEPELQHLDVGQWVPMAPFGPPSDRNAFQVHSFEADEWLLWSKPDSTWAWRLTQTDGGTRLVTRVHAVYDWHRPLAALSASVLMELGDFAMQRRMLRGIKARAEAMVRDRT